MGSCEPQPAVSWWDANEYEVIAFTRFTQLDVLRLLTTSVVMNGKPLSMHSAWTAYDRLFADDRVTFMQEPSDLDRIFRKLSGGVRSSPKMWADSWLLAFAERSNCKLITFDRALAVSSKRCLLLEP